MTPREIYPNIAGAVLAFSRIFVIDSIGSLIPLVPECPASASRYQSILCRTFPKLSRSVMLQTKLQTRIKQKKGQPKPSYDTVFLL